MSELKTSIITSEDVLEDLLAIMDMKCGFEEIVSNRPSYTYEAIMSFLKNDCIVYATFTPTDVKAIWIFQRITLQTVNFHVCTLDNRYNWGTYFKKTIIPIISKEAINLVGFLSEDQKPLVRLYKRYGYSPVWDESLKHFRYTLKLK